MKERAKKGLEVETRDAFDTQKDTRKNEFFPSDIKDSSTEQKVTKLLFGVDYGFASNEILQNNIDLFEWVVRNKIYPYFCGRNIAGKNRLTKKEIEFLHEKACKIAVIYDIPHLKETDDQGEMIATEIQAISAELGIPEGTAIFVEIDEQEHASRNYMRGFSKALTAAGYTPGFKASTDARHSRFDLEFSRGMQTDRDVFEQCLIWAVTPILTEYDRITTTHLIHPDNWKPFVPSAITRNEIAIWQYGKNCHPIFDDNNVKTVFNLNLVRNEKVIVEKMF